MYGILCDLLRSVIIALPPWNTEKKTAKTTFGPWTRASLALQAGYMFTKML
jgi:hypothetical protein